MTIFIQQHTNRGVKYKNKAKQKNKKMPEPILNHDGHRNTEQ